MEMLRNLLEFLFGWVTPTLIVAVLALWIAFDNYRRNNYVVIRILDASAAYTSSREDHSAGYQFRLVIQNLGIPVHNIFVKLGFCDERGLGWVSVPLTAGAGGAKKDGQFPKGAIAEFFFKAQQMTESDILLVSSLKDLKRQRSTMCLYADGFLVWEYRVVSRWTWLRELWNRVAFRINGVLSRKRSKTSHFRTLPILKNPALQLSTFIHDLQKRSEMPHFSPNDPWQVPHPPGGFNLPRKPPA